jgi:hypothetical protein
MHICPSQSLAIATYVPPPKLVTMTYPPYSFHLQLILDQFESKQFQQHYNYLLTIFSFIETYLHPSCVDLLVLLFAYHLLYGNLVWFLMNYCLMINEMLRR